MGDRVLQDALWLSMVFLHALWAGRVWKLGLARRYPILFTYLCFGTLLGVTGYVLHNSGLRVWGYRGYNWFWVVTRPLLWGLFFLLVFEVYSRMLEAYAGVRRLGQLVMYGALGSVATVVCILVYMDPYPRPDPDQWKAFWLIQEQSVHLSIAGLVFLLLLFKKFFGLAVLRNVQLVFTTFGLYFAGSAGLMILRTYLGPQFLVARDLASGLLYITCLAIGVLQFSQAGETEDVETRLSPESYSQTIALAQRQLHGFNDRLLRVLSP